MDQDPDLAAYYADPEDVGELAPVPVDPLDLVVAVEEQRQWMGSEVLGA